MDRKGAAQKISQESKVRIMFTNKKGMSFLITLLVFAFVALAFGFIYLFFLQGSLSKQEGIVDTQISGIQGDADKDSIRNFFDKCPCTFGDSIDEGCPATFSLEQRQEDVKKYNSKPVCGIVAGTQHSTQQTNPSAGQQQNSGSGTNSQKSGPSESSHYQSLEIFGGDDWGADPQDAVIQQACSGWVGGTGGANCHSEDDDCDGKFNLKPLKEGCWIMASEDDDIDSNDCGQAKVDEGKIISLGKYNDLTVDLNNYQSIPDESEPKNLFQWRWKSKPEYGSLLCAQGFWQGCKEANEGITKQVNGLTYKCTGSEWSKQ